MQNDTSQSDAAIGHMVDCGTESRPREEFCYEFKEAYLQAVVRQKKPNCLTLHRLG